MILHFIPGQRHYGAAHRKNVDTPSLGGSCKVAKWFHTETCRKRTVYEGRRFQLQPWRLQLEPAKKEQ
jgi:hypothetical protein